MDAVFLYLFFQCLYPNFAIQYCTGIVGSRGAWDEAQISSTGLGWFGQCIGKTAHCGAGIIEIFSGRAVLNGKESGGGADAVCVCVFLCVQESQTSMSATTDDTSMNE